MSNAKTTPEIPPVKPEDESKIRALIPKWHEELLTELPNLPAKLEVVISNRNIISALGVGGSALSERKIELDIDSSFKDKQKQLIDLKGTYFHEGFHIAQGFHFEIVDEIIPVNNAIYEGVATMFEKATVGSQTPFGDFSDVPDISQWATDLGSVSYKEFIERRREYKFYEPNTKRRWWFYRAGAYLAAMYLEKHPDTSWAEFATINPDMVWKSFKN